MAVLGIIQRQVLRVQLGLVVNGNSFHVAAPLCFHTTELQFKKPKRDLSPIAAKKKIRHIEKALNKLRVAGDRILKPIDENEVLVSLKRDVQAGTRERERNVYTSDELESQILLCKDWTRYKMKQHLEECRAFSRMQQAQLKALDKLKEESEELYKQAIALDDTLIPYEFKGPVHTPPIKDFFANDGEFKDKTDYFEVDHGLIRDEDLIKKKRRGKYL